MEEKVGHIPKWLGSRYPGSYAMLSDGPTVRTAVVLVHGFLGGTHDTWLHLQWMVDVHADKFPWWQNVDLFFFGYKSFRDSIDQSAFALLKFLDAFFPKPDPALCEFRMPPLPMGLPQPSFTLPTRSYSKLVLVGHSEGAVVIRRAIIIRCKRRLFVSPRRRKLLSAELALFAPAQAGFTPSGLIGTTYQIAKVGMFINPVLFKSTAFVEMKDGRVLQLIRTTTEQLAKHFKFSGLRARVLFGENENVVGRPAEYYCDIPDDPEPSHDHRSICKPTPKYTRPLHFIAGTQHTGAAGA
jgi:hypothetical protein